MAPGRPIICYQETGPVHLHYPSVLGTACGGHLATHSPPSNDTAQGRRHREAITQAVIGPASCPCISLMFFITITYKLSVIHPHQGEFIVEVSSSDPHVSQTFWKTVTSCHSPCTLAILLVTNMHLRKSSEKWHNCVWHRPDTTLFHSHCRFSSLARVCLRAILQDMKNTNAQKTWTWTEFRKLWQLHFYQKGIIKLMITVVPTLEGASILLRLRHLKDVSFQINMYVGNFWMAFHNI